MRFRLIASVARRMHGTALLLLVMLSMTIGGGAPWPHRLSSEARADETLTDPYLGQPDAIAAGDQIYHNHCIICHGLRGGRGPNLFATQLSDEQFLEVVIN